MEQDLWVKDRGQEGGWEEEEEEAEWEEAVWVQEATVFAQNVELVFLTRAELPATTPPAKNVVLL